MPTASASGNITLETPVLASLVGPDDVVRAPGNDCSRLRVGDRIGALTVWGADADRVCVPESVAVDVPEDLDPGEILSLLFPYMTAYQVLHRTAKTKSGESVLVHGAAGRVGIAALELGAVAGFRLYGIASARPRQGRGARHRDRATRRPGAVVGEPMDPAWFREDFGTLIELLRRGEIHPVVAERLPLADRVRQSWSPVWSRTPAVRHQSEGRHPPW